MELEESSVDFKPVHDARPIMPPPPPVRLVSVDDVHLPSAAGLEVQLDDFYVGLLKFEREGGAAGHVVYKAENFRVVFDVLEPPVDRDSMRPTGIDLPSLAQLRMQLEDRQIEYIRQLGLIPGQETLLVQDPAGNWVQIGEVRVI